ncbi:MAG: class I SAM-dependent rRNA methyltransferase, partial [Oscillospiraceae bacterium]
MENLRRLVISRRAAESVKKGYPWVYDTEVLEPGTVSDGELCLLFTEKGRYAGTAFYNSKSRLRARVVSRNASDTVDEDFWRRRVRWALEYRMKTMGRDFEDCRLIFGDADGFPGLTLDRYGDVLSAEVMCLGTDRIKDLIFRLCTEELRSCGAEVKALYERSTGRLRQLEGLGDSEGYRLTDMLGEPPDGFAEINENGLRILVDVAGGQKTGYFLDQKYNRAAAAKLSRGLTVLDCCTHTGGFALNCAAAGADQVLGIDVSEPALEMARRNAGLNGL